MADRTQLEDALIAAHTRGDTEAAQVFADEIKRLPARSEPTLRQRVQSSVPMRVWQGIRDPIDAGAQLVPRALAFATSAGGYAENPVSDFFALQADKVDRGIAENERDYTAARKATGSEGADVARVAGNVLSPANVAVATRLPAATTTLGRAAAGMAGGAAGGAMSPVTEDQGNFAQQKVVQTGVGAAAGAVVTPLLGKVADGIARRANFRASGRPDMPAAKIAADTDESIAGALREVGARPQDLPPGYLEEMRQEVARSLRAGQMVDPAALLRKRDFASLDIPPTRGQLTRDPVQFAQERNLRGVANVGEALQARFAEQNRVLGERVGELGGRSASPEFTAGQRMLENLGKVDEARRKAVSAAYAEARASSGREATVPLQGLAQDFDKVVRDYGVENIPGALKVRMSELGLMGGTQRKVFTVQDAEELLQVINKNYDPAKRAQASALDTLRAAVKDAVLTADDAGGVFAKARDLAAQRFSMHDAIPALRAAAEGTTAPDDFVRRFIVNGKTNDVRAMADLLRKEAPEALTEMREQIGARLLRAGFGENPAGDKLFRAESFAKALREFGDDKLRAVFEPAEIQQMKALSRVGAYINAQPSAAAVNYSNTAGPLLSVLGKIPGMPATLSLLNAGQKAVTTRRDVGAAVAAEIPTRPADLPAEARRRVASFLGPASVAIGGAASPTR